MATRERLTIVPLSDYPVEIGRMLWQLEDTRRDTLNFLKDISPAPLDWIPPHPKMNSVGTLLYHIALVEMDWLYAEVLQKDYSPEVIALFPYKARDETGKLTTVVGVRLEDHLSRLQTVRQWVLDEFKAINLEDFYRARKLPRYDVTPEWVLHHLVVHESEHRGEMMMIAGLASL